MACEPALAALFVPGDRHVLVGCKSGRLQLLELASGALLENVAAHGAELWGMALTADRRGFATASADKQVSGAACTDPAIPASPGRMSVVSAVQVKL